MQKSQEAALPRMVVLDEVDSTNLYAMRLIQANMAEHGQVVVAKHQTAGRGQRGKHWQSLPGENLLFSMVIETKGWPLQQQFIWNMAVALACRELVEENVGAACKIKWPNDLFIGDKKAGGILIENVVRGDWNWTVVGVGMNIHQVRFPDEIATKATSWKLENCEQSFDVKRTCEELSKKLHRNCNWVDQQQHYWEKYQAFLYKRGERINIKKGENTRQVYFLGVDSQGLAIFEQDGISEKCIHGEWEWVG